MSLNSYRLPAERQPADGSVLMLAAARCTMLGAVLWSAVAASAAPTAPPVVIATTEQRAVFEEVPISGTVSSPRVTQLSPEVAGLVQEVLVDAGDRVVAGAPLVRLDGTLAGLALEAAEAATEQASEELADAAADWPMPSAWCSRAVSPRPRSRPDARRCAPTARP